MINRRIFYYIIYVAALLGVIINAPLKSSAQSSLPLHCDADTVEIRRIITEIQQSASADASMPRGQRIAAAARALVGRGADNSLTTDSAATLSVNVDSFDPMSFVNSCIALAEASETPGGAWRVYADRLRNVACRKGENQGFASLFHHTSDWIGDNIYRGNLVELTDRYEGARSKNWSLDYMTVNRDRFPAMADPELYDRIRMHEMGFRTHKVPYLPKQYVSKKEVIDDLRDGDIIILISDKDRSDYFTFGIVVFEPDGPHLVHFSEEEGRVVLEPEPLKRYFNLMTKHFSGFRLVRVV